MSVHFVSGKLGAGKTLVSVGRIRDAIHHKKRIATNLDLFMEHLPEKRQSRVSPIRLPDKPRLEDFEALGYGCEEADYTGDKFGLLVLDELGTWFNSRSWQDKERGPVIDWFLHARKMRWDIIFIVQNVDSLDKQLVGALAEYQVVCKRMDALRVPFVGWIGRLLTGKPWKLPKVHLALSYYGTPSQGALADRWWYRGTDLYPGFDTGQVFRDGRELLNGELVDMRAPFSYLSRWHLDGRYPRPSWFAPYLAILRRVPLYLAAVFAVPISAATGRSPAATLIAWGIAKPTKDYLPTNAPGAAGTPRPVPAARMLPRAAR